MSGDLKNMLLGREGKRAQAEERLAAAKKRRLMDNLERQDRLKEQETTLWQGAANPLLAAPTEADAPLAIAAPVLLKEAKTEAQKREKAVRQLLMSVGFFDPDVEAQLPQEAAADDDVEQVRSARAVLDLSWFTSAEASARNAGSGAASEKSKKELELEVLQMHKDLAELEEKAIAEAEVGEDSWHDGRAREDAQLVEDHRSRLDRIKKRRDDMVARGLAANVKPPAAEMSDSDSGSSEDLAAWQVKRKK
eukprot:TRINITY_DN14823_c0_g1_i1.p1 TRINITY_DN14823_c0_g1~~TRINITY_DN14823_c0_g1_i1.p1  ORF type:complete len:250 (+),score=88.65 TRINITY_DN14823_c0_g1_i1:96-845(+)